MSAYATKRGTFMFVEKVLNVDNGKERMDIMEVCPNQIMAYPSFREYECPLASQVFYVFRFKRGNYAIWKKIVATLVCSFRLADICNGADALGVTCIAES